MFLAATISIAAGRVPTSIVRNGVVAVSVAISLAKIEMPFVCALIVPFSTKALTLPVTKLAALVAVVL